MARITVTVDGETETTVSGETTTNIVADLPETDCPDVGETDTGIKKDAKKSFSTFKVYMTTGEVFDIQEAQTFDVEHNGSLLFYLEKDRFYREDSIPICAFAKGSWVRVDKTR